MQDLRVRQRGSSFIFFEESAAGNQSNGQAFVIWFANRIRQKRPTSCSRWVGRLKRKLSKHFQFLYFLKKDWKITDWLIGAAPFAWQSRATSETSAPEVAKLFDTCPVLSWISMAFGIDGTPNTCHLFFVCVAPVQNWRAAWHLIRHKNEQTSGPWRWFTMPALGCNRRPENEILF